MSRIFDPLKSTWWFALAAISLAFVYEAVFGGKIGFGVLITIAIFGWSYIGWFLVIDGIVAAIRRVRTRGLVTGYAKRSLGYLLWSVILSGFGFGGFGIVMLALGS